MPLSCWENNLGTIRLGIQIIRQVTADEDDNMKNSIHKQDSFYLSSHGIQCNKKEALILKITLMDEIQFQRCA